MLYQCIPSNVILKLIPVFQHCTVKSGGAYIHVQAHMPMVTKISDIIVTKMINIIMYARCRVYDNHFSEKHEQSSVPVAVVIMCHLRRRS